MPNNYDLVYLKHILDAIEKINRYTENVSETEFKRNTLIQDGVIRQLEIIGEAVGKISPEMKLKHNNLPWSDIAGMRNKLIYDYFGVDIDTVWLTAKRDTVEIKEVISAILNS